MDPTLAQSALANPEVDGSDPAVVVVAWLLTWAIARWCPEKLRSKVRPILPAIALVVALATRGGISAIQGEAITVEALLRALAAGAMAVAGHSQFRELSKSMVPPAVVLPLTTPPIEVGAFVREGCVHSYCPHPSQCLASCIQPMSGK